MNARALLITLKTRQPKKTVLASARTHLAAVGSHTTSQPLLAFSFNNVTLSIILVLDVSVGREGVEGEAIPLLQQQQQNQHHLVLDQLRLQQRLEQLQPPTQQLQQPQIHQV